MWEQVGKQIIKESLLQKKKFNSQYHLNLVVNSMKPTSAKKGIGDCKSEVKINFVHFHYNAL